MLRSDKTYRGVVHRDGLSATEGDGGEIRGSKRGVYNAHLNPSVCISGGESEEEKQSVVCFWNNGQREEKLVSNGMKRITFVAYVMNGGRVIQRKTKRQRRIK